MSKRSTVVKEPDFQTVTNEYARGSIETMREELKDEAQRERIISEGALEVTVRGDWTSPGQDAGSDALKPTDYRILLGTGGPASRIVGELDQYCQPTTASFEYQDWFKPWTAADDLTNAEQATLLEYAQQFWFGE